MKNREWRQGWVAIFGGLDCGHAHRTYRAAVQCMRSLIAGYAPGRDEAREHGESYPDYVARWVSRDVLYRTREGDLVRSQPKA